MKKIKIFVLFIFSIAVTLPIFSQKTDPYHIETGGFGYNLGRENDFSIWWCEGAYKIMYDTPIPKNRSRLINLSSAKNEYEPFQLIINSRDSLKNFKISIENFYGPYGEISSENVDIHMVEYVNVTKPTDSYGYKGMWPDPLPELKDQTTLSPGRNNTIWITVYIPESAMPGIYNSKIHLSSDRWSKEIPIKVNVWDFTLPRESTMRSGFGLSVDKISDYHNISNRGDLVETFDKYMQAFRDYKISPYNFYYLNPIEQSIDGVEWKGGFFDSSTKMSGKYSLRVEDNSMTESKFAFNINHTEINSNDYYIFKWAARALEVGQQYNVVIEGYDSNKKLLLYENRVETFSVDTTWKNTRFDLGTFSETVNTISVSLYPAFRTASGEHTGTVWFDNLSLTTADDKPDLIQGGSFDVSVDSININLDFTEFDLAAKRYLDEFGFNGFRLNLEGMGSGSYYSRTEGSIAGFSQDTEEYTKLMQQYLSQIEQHLKENGWLGKEYIYWFDEPGRQDYPFVREGMETIKNAAPLITTFLTENDPGPEIMDVTDITCTIWHKIDPDKARAISSAGQQYWSYLCTAPKAPWVSEFIDHDAINLRIWLWMSYSYKLDGILIWSSNYWTSREATPTGYLQNPWEQPASFVQGYGWPLGKQTVWGNGDGRFWYPPNRNPNSDKKKYIEGPVPSIRLEFLRQGIEDYEYLIMLENLIEGNGNLGAGIKKRAQKLLSLPEYLFKDGKTYTKNPADLLEYRQELANMILEIQNLNN